MSGCRLKSLIGNRSILTRLPLSHLMLDFLHLWILFASSGHQLNGHLQRFLHQRNTWEWTTDDPQWRPSPRTLWPEKIRFVGRLALVCRPMSAVYRPALQSIAWNILTNHFFSRQRRFDTRCPHAVRRLRLLKLSYPNYKAALQEMVIRNHPEDQHPLTESDLEDFVASSSEEELLV